jgi:hypothetical protein
VAELADAQDLKSWAAKAACGFDSHPRQAYMNCIHGLDARFCAACNRSDKSKARSAAGRTSLEEILVCLNGELVRATYGAVAELLGVNPRSMGILLGPRRPEASWIVSAENGLPADYDQAEWHPALLSRGEIITSARALLLRMTIRRGRASTT